MPSSTETTRSSDLSKFLGLVNKIDRYSFLDDGERNEALLAAYALVNQLETPWETVMRFALTQPALSASLKIAEDLNLFRRWEETGGGPKTSKELAILTDCDALLLDRLLRHMAANNVLKEKSPTIFVQSDLTRALTEPVFAGWINYLYDATLPCFGKLPEYLAQVGYTNPKDPSDGVFQYTKSFKGTLFDYYDVNPKESATFNDMLGGVMARQASWLDIYPHQSLVNPDPKEIPPYDGCPLLVDIGGNIGRDIERFRQAHPNEAGRLILQDRPEVVKHTICQEPVKVMAHDFFGPQPIKGARAYFMHGIIHDWADEPATKILQHLKDAMTPGWSRLLICDHVISEDGSNPQATAFDLTMMVKVAALERTESGWYRLLESTGLKVVKIWKSKLARQSVIEAVVA